mmetsp:Transcript_1355/g.4696  ORF Transcript_1355/g.4696 Transcript_1355/m.4696 type:complete len:455 (-) Transcript_1355:194-1558(-)
MMHCEVPAAAHTANPIPALAQQMDSARYGGPLPHASFLRTLQQQEAFKRNFLTAFGEQSTHMPNVQQAYDAPTNGLRRRTRPRQGEEDASEPGSTEETTHRSGNGSSQKATSGASFDGEAAKPARKVQVKSGGKHVTVEHECPICHKVCASPAETRKHMEVVHHGRRDHVCHHCGKAFGFGNDLRRHIRTVHEKRRDYHCPFEGCGKSFAHGWTLNNHIKMQHEAKWRPTAPNVPMGHPKGNEYDQDPMVSLIKKYQMPPSMKAFEQMNKGIFNGLQGGQPANGMAHLGSPMSSSGAFGNINPGPMVMHANPSIPFPHCPQIPSPEQSGKPPKLEESPRKAVADYVDINAPSAFKAHKRHRGSSSPAATKDTAKSTSPRKRPTRSASSTFKNDSATTQAGASGKSKRGAEEKPVASSDESLVSEPRALKFTPRGSAQALNALLEIAFREQNCAA